MKPKILDLIDFEKVNALLEGFNKTTGFVTAILDLEGNVLSKSGWRQMCTDFHRINPETSKKCTISDTVLANKMEEGEKYHFYKCLNGLVDAAVPILINGEHIANLFSGQFFFEEPDSNFFEKQAEKYGFDKSIYLKALGDVPVVSEEKVKTAMGFLLNMTQLISEMTLQKMEQIELNEKLSKNNLLIDNIIDNSNALIYVTDREGKFQMVNKELEHLFAMHKTELIGKLRNDFMPKEIADQHRRNDLSVIQSKKSITIEEEDLKSDGKHYYLTQKFPLFDENGEVQGIGGISTDITERKRAELELKRSETLLNETQRITKVGGWEYDVLTDKNYFSDEIFNIYGITKDKVLDPEEALKFYHPDDRTIVSDCFSKAIAQGEPYNIKVRFINARSENLWVRTAGKPVLENGKVVKVIGNLMDITERILAEEKLRESEEKFRTLITAGSDSVYRMSPDWSVMYELDGRGFIIDTAKPNAAWFPEYIPPDDQENVTTVIQEAIRTKSLFELEHRVWRVDGSLGWTFSRAIPRLDANGEIFEWFGAASDITDRKQSEEKLQESYALLRIAGEKAKLGGWSVNLEENRSYWSDQVATIHEMPIGYSPLVEDGINFYAPEWRDKITEVFTRCAQEGISYDEEMEIITSTEKRVWVRTIGEAVRDERGKIVKVNGAFQDITERKQAEAEIRKQLDELRHWYEVTLGREGRVLELKQEVNDLLKQHGEPLRYRSTTLKNPDVEANV